MIQRTLNGPSRSAAIARRPRIRILAARRLVVLAAGLLSAASSVFAEVADVTITDVTTRAFSVVWVSSEPVLAGTTVQVFNDIDGNDEISASLDISLLSEDVPGAMTQGIVKVDVIGTDADATLFVRTTTVGASGTVQSPALGALLEVRTAATTRKGDAAGVPIVNDVVLHEIFDPDGVTAGEGSLLVVKVPSLSAYPLTAFVADGFVSPAAAVDLNNVFDDATGESARVEGGTVLEVSEFRGLRCSGLADHKLLRFRRAPVHEESPPITELELAAPCFFADTVCDDVVNILDAQRVLNIFNAALGECAFNPDLDLVADDEINILDVQSLLNRFGQSAPFAP